MLFPFLFFFTTYCLVLVKRGKHSMEGVCEAPSTHTHTHPHGGGAARLPSRTPSERRCGRGSDDGRQEGDSDKPICTVGARTGGGEVAAGGRADGSHVIPFALILRCRARAIRGVGVRPARGAVTRGTVRLDVAALGALAAAVIHRHSAAGLAATVGGEATALLRKAELRGGALAGGEDSLAHPATFVPLALARRLIVAFALQGNAVTGRALLSIDVAIRRGDARAIVEPPIGAGVARRVEATTLLADAGGCRTAKTRCAVAPFNGHVHPALAAGKFCRAEGVVADKTTRRAGRAIHKAADALTALVEIRHLQAGLADIGANVGAGHVAHAEDVERAAIVAAEYALPVGCIPGAARHRGADPQGGVTCHAVDNASSLIRCELALGLRRTIRNGYFSAL